MCVTIDSLSSDLEVYAVKVIPALCNLNHPLLGQPNMLM